MQMQFAKAHHHLHHLADGSALMPPPLPMGPSQSLSPSMADAQELTAAGVLLGNGGLKRAREDGSSGDSPPGKKPVASEGDVRAEYGEGGEVTRLPVRAWCGVWSGSTLTLQPVCRACALLRASLHCLLAHTHRCIPAQSINHHHGTAQYTHPSTHPPVCTRVY